MALLRAKISAIDEASRHNPLIKIEPGVEVPGYNFYCAECAQPTITLASLDKHFTKFHSGKYSCSFPGCSRCYTIRYSLERHVKTEHPGWSVPNVATGQYLCKDVRCGVLSADADKLATHLLSAHGCILQDLAQRPFRCAECLTACTSMVGITRHHRKYHSHTEFVNIEDLQKEQDQLLQSARVRHAATFNTATGQSIGSSSSDEARGISNYPMDILKTGETVVSISEDEDLPALAPSVAVPADTTTAPFPPSQKMTIGSLLNTPPFRQESFAGTEPDDDDEDYPEAIALDDDERREAQLGAQSSDMATMPEGEHPLPPSRANSIYIQEQSNYPDVEGRLLDAGLVALNFHHIISMDVVIELWKSFLTREQRIHTFAELVHISRCPDYNEASLQLGISALNIVLNAWLDLRCIALAAPIHLQPKVWTARTTAETVLRHCRSMENAVVNWRDIDPNILRAPPPFRPKPYASLEELFTDMLLRVKCREVHSEGAEFNNITVLKQMKDYALDLKRVLEASVPESAKRGEAWREIVGQL